ncbi:MAG TPA: glycosyltransferase [Candidatus Saccharimonadales bacterium]|nr:glycosyltransferase [Candidatus Saccharimonadales bacterium]
MKVALVYDRINKWGGAARVLLALHEIFPDAPLYTSVYNPSLAPWAKVFTVKTSFLQNFPYASSHHEMLATLMPIAFESFSFSDYDLVISVTSEAAKGIVTQPHTKHICICLTPTRYLWSGYDTYFPNKLFKFLTKPIVRYLKRWDAIVAQRPDVYIAISKEVQKRIKKYYERDSLVVYPPLSFTVNGSPFKKVNKTTKNRERRTVNYFLVVSRLVPYKRIDIVVEACTKLGIPLKIVGSGSEERYLRSIAGSTIEFYNNLTDEELTTYYKECSAFLFPGIEDFGLTIIEAQQFGKPVIAYKGGGALETIIEGKTGEFFYPQTVLGLVNTLQKLLKKGILGDYSFSYSENAKENVQRFSKERFKKELLEQIDILFKK